MEKLSPKLLNWASICEPGVKEQALLSASMPFVHPYIALMPDCHVGKGSTVGSVIPTLRAIMPAAVGVDIGCGMMAYRTELVHEDIVDLDLAALRESIERVIPLSAGKYNDDLYDDGTQARIQMLWDTPGVKEAEEIAGNWDAQLGSLGSGNHFIEISLDEDDRVWLFLHSGSRGVGNKIATKHIRKAQQLCEKWWVRLPHTDLAYLAEDTPEFEAYITEMRWAQKFAYLNREEMMDRVYDQLKRAYGGHIGIEMVINCHHNYTEKERHAGKDVWLSRKGAIDASEGTWGLIPGSMGAKSYVVQGKGNRAALNSSPHGAGRLHSRRSAKATFTREMLDEAMEGIEWGRKDAFLDEHPGAYKPVEQIMEDAADLVEIKHTLRQIVNVKGD